MRSESHSHLPRVCLAVSLTIWLCAVVILANGCTSHSVNSVRISSGCVDAVPTLHLTLHSERAAQYRLTAIGNWGSRAMPAEYSRGGEEYIKRRVDMPDVTDVSIETYQEADSTWRETDYLQLERCEN